MKRKKRVGGSRKADGGRIASLKASGGGDAEGDGRPMAPGPWRRPVKKRITLYLDADVLAWFKQKPRYQKEINRALWKVMREGGKEFLE
jgi:uncharacterized protein (DUF4415 family)